MRKVDETKEGLELNGTLQLEVCVDEVNVLGVNINIIRKNMKILLHTSKETGLELNT